MLVRVIRKIVNNVKKKCFLPEIQSSRFDCKTKSKDVLKIIPIDSLLSSNYPISGIEQESLDLPIV
jgi:hypothetical protein